MVCSGGDSVVADTGASDQRTTYGDGDARPGVCVVTHPLGAAGENATRSLLEILAAITDVALVTANLPEDSRIRRDHEVVEVSRRGAGNSVPVDAGRFLLTQLRMCAAIRRRPEPIVLFFGATSYIIPILFARILGRTVLVEPRGDVPLTLRITWERRMPGAVAATLAGLVRLLERAGFGIAHGVITYTPAMAAELGLDPDSPNLFPRGARYVDTDRFSVSTPYEDRRTVVGFLGRLDEEKGIRELATVAADLQPDVTFRFVGDGDLRSWLERELEAEIDAGAVEVTGWLDHDDVPDALNELALLVLPSQPTEGLPTTILEALACGTPVYASPVSGVPDVVRDGETGFHVRCTDPTALREGIEEILARNDLGTIAANGRALIEADYDFEAACDRYRAILTEVDA